MKTLAATVAILLSAGLAHGQTPPAQTPARVGSATSLTHDLNSGPPAPVVHLAPAPATSPAPTPAPTAAPAPARVPAPVPTAAPAPAIAPAPAAVPSIIAPAVPPEASPPPPAAPTVTVLDSAARAALPFTAELPPGFEIVGGRPGPDFRIYTIRRGAQSFVMVYTGPASQFPIYSGQMVEAGGRASVVSTEDGVRHAMEHLYQRPAAPREIHIWTMSLDGADRALAEQIAQSVDVR